MDGDGLSPIVENLRFQECNSLGLGSVAGV